MNPEVLDEIIESGTGKKRGDSVAKR